MVDKATLGSCQRPRHDKAGGGSADNHTARQILRICQKIESKVSSLNKVELENTRLMASLNHVENNFLMLLRTSQSEIAKLKRGLQNNTRSHTYSNNRNRGICVLDPHQVIHHSDLIDCLHTPLKYEITTEIRRSAVSRHPGAPTICRTPSSSSHSSSRSSTSSTSPSSSSLSACGQNSRSQQHQQPPSLLPCRSLVPVSSVDCGNKSLRCDISTEISKNPFRQQKNNFTECHFSMTYKSVPSTSISEKKSGFTNEGVHPTKSVASTGIDSGPAAHLLRLVGTSVRSARDHHSVSVKLAPPTRGKCPNDEEKATIDAYFQAEEERCVEALKRPHSQSPQRSLPFSPTLFARRQMLKHSSLCSPTPSQSPSCTVTNASTSDLHPKCTESHSIPPIVMVNEVGTKTRNTGRVSPLISPIRPTPSKDAPRTPEVECNGIDSKLTEGKEKQQSVEARACLGMMAKEEQEFAFVGTENSHIDFDSPRIEIEEDISEVESHQSLNPEEGEPMSEGEVDDEEEEDAMEEETGGERPNIDGHSKQCRSNLKRKHQHESNAISHHESRRRVTTSYMRHRSTDEVKESLAAKRSRRLSDGRESYTRLRNSLPPPHSLPRHSYHHTRAPAPTPFPPPRRRFPSNGGRTGKFVDVLVHRTRHSPIFMSHRSTAVAFRNLRRSETLRSFTHRR